VPYCDREKQLQYMREYMKRKRMIHRLERLKQRKQQILEDVEKDDFLRIFLKSQGVTPGEYIEKEIERLEGLLKDCNKVAVLGGEVNRKPC
jgi:hypothetical protein